MPSNPSDPETPRERAALDAAKAAIELGRDMCKRAEKAETALAAIECHEGEHGECGVDANGVVCMSCWSVIKQRLANAEAALAEAQSKLKMLQDAARPTIAEVLAPERLAVAEAAIARVRAMWPHIEIPVSSLAVHGKREIKDPGSPTCLRCKIEEAINA